MKERKDLLKENEKLKIRLTEAQELLAAIKSGAVDALITDDQKVFILKGADYVYRVIVENMNEGAAVLGLDGTVMYCNDSLAKALGFPIKNIISRSIFDFFGADEIPRLKSILRRSKNQTVRAEFQIKKNDKALFPVIVSCNSLKIENTGVCMVITDLTQQKNDELEIHEQREELLHITRIGKLAEFVSSLAHEISQPLAAILSYVQAAKRMFADREPELQKILSYIVNDDQRASEVIQRLRSLLKKSKPEMKLLDINTVINETIVLITTDATVRNIYLKLELERNLSLVRCDKIQLQQVLLNLISNSFDAMDNNRNYREISIRTSRKDTNTIVVAVKDSGCGIPAQNIPKLFTHFFTSKPDGLGMGLSISRSIIEAHGGRLDVKNNPDRGATFSFTIPIDVKDA